MIYHRRYARDPISASDVITLAEQLEHEVEIDDPTDRYWTAYLRAAERLHVEDSDAVRWTAERYALRRVEREEQRAARRAEC